MSATPHAPALSLRAVSKSYRIWETPSARLSTPCWEKIGSMFPAGSEWRHRLEKRAAKNYRDFWALKDISFEVKRGESIALIGRNGSGKSTLLQLIASTLKPSSGEVEVFGRVAALLELGAGFDAEFTGRENVYINASILGLSRAEIDAQLGDIAAFAEIGEFFDQPVKTYSSGMVVRLAFAVAAHVKPDILIVDEALSVGDARFQLKCARAIDRFIADGVTLLFVSHDLSLVKRLCRRALLLEQGRLLYSGHPNDVANLYSKLIAEGGSAESLATDIVALNTKLARAREEKAEPDTQPELGSNPAVTPASPPSHARNVKTAGASSERAIAALAHTSAVAPLTGDEFAYGGEKGEITHVLSLDADQQIRSAFSAGESLTARLCVQARCDIAEPIYAVTLKTAAGVEIYGTNTLFSGQHAPAIRAGDRREIDFVFPLALPGGAYFLSFGFTFFEGDNLVVVHRRYDAVKIEVHSAERTVGLVNLGAKITERSSA
jgi:ABC-type polysaccharide/polyol phosphate transport system ATPase subunit